MTSFKPRIALADRYAITNAAGLAPIYGHIQQFLDLDPQTEATHRAYREEVYELLREMR